MLVADLWILNVALVFLPLTKEHGWLDIIFDSLSSKCRYGELLPATFLHQKDKCTAHVQGFKQKSVVLCLDAKSGWLNPSMQVTSFNLWVWL